MTVNVETFVLVSPNKPICGLRLSRKGIGADKEKVHVTEDQDHKYFIDF